MPITGFANENAVIYRSWMEINPNTMRIISLPLLLARRINSRLKNTQSPPARTKMGRVGEVQSIHRVGVGAADDLHAAKISPLQYSCGGSGSQADCYGQFDCTDVYGCTIRTFDCVNFFECMNTFNCKGNADYKCDQENAECAPCATYNPNYC